MTARIVHSQDGEPTNQLTNERSPCYRNNSKEGFTLIELLVAISIIAIISAIGFLSYSTAQLTARDARRKQDLNSISVALQLYYQTNKGYPLITGSVTSLSPNWTTLFGASYTNYINSMPVDPVNVSPRVYTYSNPDGLNDTFTLCANLENSSDPAATATCTGGNYQVKNP